MMHALATALAVPETPRRLWTPQASLENGATLAAWWDAGVGVTESGGLVSAWADRVGGAVVAQSTGSAKPVVSATAINGAAYGLTFDGSDDYLALAPAPATFVMGDNPGWMFVLVAQNALVAEGAVTRAPAAYGTSNLQHRLYRTVSGGVNKGRYLIDTTNTGDAAADFSGVSTFLGVSGSGSSGGRVDGVDITPAAVVGVGSQARVRIGSDATSGAPGSYWLGAVGQVLVGGGVLTASDTYRLEGWAAWSCAKPDLLPANHSYRYAPPYRF